MTRDALLLAKERGLDLVEVAPQARPPVCRVQDSGRFKYDKSKKETAARKNQVIVKLKEVKLRVKTDEHDLEVKRKHAERFLLDGDKVKVSLRFRGREMAHKDIGELRCREFAALVEEVGAVESPPRMDGRQMMMILAPKKKKGTT
jgi:translation initiation factor IF-3